MPLIGKQIILLYHDHDPDHVEVLLETRSHSLLRTLDLAVNCRVKRGHLTSLPLASSVVARSHLAGVSLQDMQAYLCITSKSQASNRIFF